MVLIGINSGHYVDEAFDMGDSDIEWLLQQPESSEDYNGLLGGEVNVCQTEADLKEIVDNRGQTPINRPSPLMKQLMELLAIRLGWQTTPAKSLVIAIRLSCKIPQLSRWL